MKKFFAEFKEFAMRGNVLDMAIGVVIACMIKKSNKNLAAEYALSGK